MLLTVFLAALLCILFWLLVPASFLVIGSWPVVQIGALVIGGIAYWIWRKLSAANAMNSHGSTDSQRQKIAFGIALSVGAIAIGGVAMPQAWRMLKGCDQESGELCLGAMDDQLMQLERWDKTADQIKAEPSFTRGELSAASAAASALTSNGVTLQSLDKRISVQRGMLDSRAMSPNSYRYDETVKRLREIDETRARYVAMPFRLVCCWATIICTLLFIAVSLVMLRTSFKTKPQELIKRPVLERSDA